MNNLERQPEKTFPLLHSTLEIAASIKPGRWVRWLPAICLCLGFCAMPIPAAHADGGPGYMLGFNGSSDYVSVPSSFSLSNSYPMTVTVWFHTVQAGSAGLVARSGGGLFGWQVFLQDQEIHAAYVGHSGSVGDFNTNALSGGVVTDDQWHHVAFTVDASGGKLYVDGMLKDTRPWTGTPSMPLFQPPLELGRLGGGSYYAGYLDEVTLWTNALSQSQIQADRGRILTGDEDGLLVYYRCDEILPDGSLPDSAPLGGTNNGTVYGTYLDPSNVHPFSPYADDYSAIINGTSATLRGIANPEGTNTSVWFEWGTSTNYDHATAAQAMGAGTGQTNFDQVLNGLAIGETYDFRAVASNTFGMAFGANMSFTLPAFYDIGAGLSGVFGITPVWGDYDNDGRLDFLIAGNTNYAGTPVTQLWRNTGSGFTHVPVAGLRDIGVGSLAWGDFDNDGRLDFLLAGSKEGGVSSQPQLWRNTGTGFTNVTATAFPPPGTNGLPFDDSCSVAWRDYDNDGRLDFLLTGYGLGGTFVCQLWHNTGNGFTNVPIAGLPGIYHASLAWGDYDNDGRADILLTGFDGTNNVSQLWRNTGTGFTNVPVAGLPGVANSSVAWGDYDNDGRLDFLLTGYDGTNGVSQLWRNTGTGFTNVTGTVAPGLPQVYDSSVAWGDFDNDGRLDFLLAGALEAPPYDTCQLWRNTGSGFVNVPLPGFPSVHFGHVAWGDYDNDGRLDILVSGQLNTGPILQVWRNNMPQTNTPPVAPTGLSVVSADHFLIFSWNTANDAQTPANGLTYNLRIGTSPGAADVMSAMAASSGLRLLPQQGNAEGRQFAFFHYYTLSQPYYWSVQTVDSAFAGSPFAPEQSFKVLQASPVVVSVTATNLVDGDLNGDGVVDQDEFAAVLANLNGNGSVNQSDLNLVLSNYWPNSPWLYMTNVAGLGGTNVTFALTNNPAGAFSVEYSTNLVDWYFLGPAIPRYLFTDTNAPAEPQRFYRLRWP